MRRWILVSNASDAALYVNVRPGELVLLRRFDHSASRAKNRDLTTSINGRKPGGGLNAYGSPGAEPHTEPKAVEHQRFARELAAEVNAGQMQHAYDRLIVFAPPHFLGLLRPNLNPEVRSNLEISVDKDLTHLPERDLSEVVAQTIRNGSAKAS